MTEYLESWICCGSLCEEYNNNSNGSNSNSSMTEEEVHCLRAANQRLEHEVQTLMGWNRHLEKELMASREQFEGERVLVKCLKKDMEAEIKFTRETLTKKYERNIAELKIRMGLEQSQSLELQKIQLEREFRSDLMTCIHKKDSQLHHLFTHSQQVQREADQKLTSATQRYHTTYEIYLEKLKQDFKRQLTRLLLELKSKERKIAALERSFLAEITPPISPTSPNQSMTHGCHRNKSYYRRSGRTQHPYSTEARKKINHATIMKETDDFQRDQFYILHQYGGFPLETLPEVSEDESKPEESISLPSHNHHHKAPPPPASLPPSNHTNVRLINKIENHNSSLVRCRCDSELSEDEFDIENEKVLSLEATIRQLQEELRESKEQNELLEFRLLELEEFETPSNRVTDERGSNVEKSGVEELHLSSSQVVLCGRTEVSSEVTNNGDYEEGSNSHSSVAESRSSCSDCSESLSLQESGIFENQFSEEQSVTTSRSEEEIGRELANLATQIESLVLGFGEDDDDEDDDDVDERHTEEKPNSKLHHKRGIIMGNGGRGGEQTGQQNFPSDLKFCRQRIHEFEKRLAKFTDVTYMHNLEDKVSSLIQENRRLEEERAELEEAENDSRHQFQRLEEKMKELRGKNSLVQQQLSNERRFIEQLRIQILQLQEGEEELCSQLSRVESLAQNYEQRNFELEESQIEIKCTLQIMLHSIPLLILWYLWHYRKQQRQRCSQSHDMLQQLLDRDHSTILPSPLLLQQPPPLPTSTPPNYSRKHKLKNEITVTMIEPKLKKLRCEKERSWYTLSHYQHQAGVIGEEEIIRIVPFTKSIVLVGHAEAQTQTNDDYLLEPKQQYHNKSVALSINMNREAEEFYKAKINQLECENNRAQELFVLEKEILEKHRVTILEKAEETYAKYQEIAKEKLQAAEDKWDSLIKELEQFAASIAKNLNEGCKTNDTLTTYAPGIGSSNNNNTPVQSGSSSEIKGVKIKGESLVANRIRSLFPDEWLCRGKAIGRTNTITTTPKNSLIETTNSCVAVSGSNTSTTSSSSSSNCFDVVVWNPKSELVKRLEERFEESRTREKVLLYEIDRLKLDIKEKHNIVRVESFNNNNNSKELIHLTEENNRLQMMLSEQETAWLSVKELEDENEKLTAELTSSATLQRKLAETYTMEKILRQRVEELEQNELHWKELLREEEKKGKKFMDGLNSKLKFLNEEVEFLRTKCSQLQDDLKTIEESKNEKENKFKLDIQLLQSKLELSATALEEREQSLEFTEFSLRSQISKLREELNDFHQQLADSECSNGMLSEEIEALERALQEAVENNNKNEIQVKILKSDMELKENLLTELQREVTLIKQREGGGKESSFASNPNDLDVFAKNEGGLIGVTREVNNIMEILQNCNRCKSAVSKLTEVSDQLNTLTLIMLGGTQHDYCIYRGEEQVPNLLTRCESEEQLLNQPPVMTTKLGQSHEQLSLGLHEMKEENLYLKSHIVQLEADLTLKDKEVRHFTDRNISTTQAFLSREKNIKECHLNEAWWWKSRCQEKNDIIYLLARRLAHLSANDMHDGFLEGILKEIQQLRDSNYPTTTTTTNVVSSNPVDIVIDPPHDCDSLLTFIKAERKRIVDLLESTCDDIENQLENQHHNPDSSTPSVDFRVLRRIGEESLLVSWTMPEFQNNDKVDGYEIFVNGNMFLRIPKPNRYKALLFGLDMSEPIHLSLKCTGAFKLQESSITYIA